MRHGTGACAVLRHPLMRAGRALREFPLVAEQVLEVVVAPLRRRRGPGDFQAAGDRVTADARAQAVPPTEALLLDTGRLRLLPDVLRRRAGAVGLAEGMTARDHRNGLLVIHGHP